MTIFLASNALTLAFCFRRVKLTLTVISLGARFSSACACFIWRCTWPSGTHSHPRPSYRSQGWTVSIHPEGKPYVYNTAEDEISVVTEETTISRFVYSTSHTTNTNLIPWSFHSEINSSFVHAVPASLQVPTSGHSPLSMDHFCLANIPCLSH